MPLSFRFTICLCKSAPQATHCRKSNHSHTRRFDHTPLNSSSVCGPHYFSRTHTNFASMSNLWFEPIQGSLTPWTMRSSQGPGQYVIGCWTWSGTTLVYTKGKNVRVTMAFKVPKRHILRPTFYIDMVQRGLRLERRQKRCFGRKCKGPWQRNIVIIEISWIFFGGGGGEKTTTKLPFFGHNDVHSVYEDNGREKRRKLLSLLE